MMNSGNAAATAMVAGTKVALRFMSTDDTTAHAAPSNIVPTCLCDCAFAGRTPFDRQRNPRDTAMRTLIAGITSVALLVTFAGTADAARKGKKYRHYDSYSQRYPHATPRQLQNLRAYERGEYYETYSKALPVGSRAWFEQKEREGGDRRF
jgi:hypothetical protein